jgi:hypothetical protein
LTILQGNVLIYGGLVEYWRSAIRHTIGGVEKELLIVRLGKRLKLLVGIEIKSKRREILII